MPSAGFINICPLFVASQPTLKFGFKTLLDTSSSSIVPSTSKVLKRLLLAYRHYILKVYFSDFYLPNTEPSHHPTQSYCMYLVVPPSALLLEATWGSNGFSCPGSSQSSSLTKERESLKNESPHPSLPSSLTHCLAIISMEQPDNELPLEINMEQASSALNTINLTPNTIQSIYMPHSLP